MRASSTNKVRRHAISRRFAAICSETVALGLSTPSRTVGPGDAVTGTNRLRYFSPSIVTVVTRSSCGRPFALGRPASVEASGLPPRTITISRPVRPFTR